MKKIQTEVAPAQTAKAPDVTLVRFEDRRVDEDELDYHKRLSEWHRQWGAKVKAWKEMPLVDKVYKVVAFLKTTKPGDNVYDRMRREIGYPFFHENFWLNPNFPGNKRLQHGRIHLTDGTPLEWQIWSIEHRVVFGGAIPRRRDD